MSIYFDFSLIAVVSIAIIQISAGFLCPNPDYSVPVCLTKRSEYKFGNSGWTNVRNCKFGFQI